MDSMNQSWAAHRHKNQDRDTYTHQHEHDAEHCGGDCDDHGMPVNGHRPRSAVIARR